jgi:diguanylate cyclase (GGDEF)-like protein/PAS domain S-box-containing protein
MARPVEAGLLAGGVSRPWLTRILGVVRRLGAAQDLQDILQRITESVVEVLEFGAAAINVTLPDGSLRVDAVAGPAGIGEAILGTVASRAAWDALFASSDRWGALRYLPGDRQPAETEMAGWTPERDERDEPDAWRAEDSLFAPLLDGDGNLLGVLSVDEPASGLRPDLEQRTVLELFAAEAANALSDAMRRARLSDSEVVFRRVFTDAPVPMLVVDGDLVLLHANDAFRLLAATPDYVRATRLTALVEPEDVAQLERACRAVTAGDTDAMTVEHRLVSVDRLVRWVRSTISRIDTEIAGPRLVIRLEDVTEDRRALEELRRLADHDALTGLPNRRIARRRLEHLLAEGGDHRVAVLYCDLDGFKQVNDRLGHTAGDEMLSLVAARLSRVIRPPDLLCREGGDEFVVIASVGAADQPEVIAQRCIDALVAPFALRSGPAAVSLSVGIAVAAGPGGAAPELLREADAALYRAKFSGRNRWSYAVDGWP